MTTSGTEALRTELHAAGLRATGARVAVLRALRSSTGPLSHGEIVQILGTGTWNRATLYRNLIDLEKAGLARRTQLGEPVWRFEDASSDHGVRSHPHFVCTACSKVVCLPPLEVAPRAVADCRHAIGQSRFEIQLRGVCDACEAAR